MGKLYADASGAIVRALITDTDDTAYGPPPIYTEVLEFDPDTNTTLVDDLYKSTSAFRLSGGVLTRSGQVVTVAPESTARTDLKQLATIRDGLRTYYAKSSPTNAESVLAIKALIRALGINFDIYLKR
jgi:hypothetical protein